MEGAFATCDVALLRLARDPMIGRAITAFVPPDDECLAYWRQTLLIEAPDDPEAVWRAWLPESDMRRPVLHDLSGLPDATTMWDVEALDDAPRPYEWPEVDYPRRAPLCRCEEQMREVENATHDLAKDEAERPKDTS